MGRKTRKVRIKGVTLFDNPADYDLEIKKSKIHGVGLFTKKAIKKGRTIAPYNHKKKHVMTQKTKTATRNNRIKDIEKHNIGNCG